ncbi:MAG: hypothetical protein AAGE01_22755 [Pseudomonadota bacterium]
MTERILGLAACLLALSVWAADPADADIKAALYDIDRYEQQFGAVTQARTTNVKRTLKLLEIARGRLDQSPNKGHPSWQEADARYKALVAHMEGLLGGSSAPAPAASAPTAPAPPPPAPAASAAAPQMISSDRARIKKLGRDIASAVQTMDQGGVKPFQDPAYVQRFEQLGARFGNDLARYEAFSGDADVQAATAELQRFNAMLAFGRDQGAQASAELGDVQATLAAIDQRMRASRMPTMPEAPYADDVINRWIEAAAAIQQAAQQDLAALAPIAEKASLPLSRGTVDQGAAYDSQDLSRLQNGLQGKLRDINQTLELLELNLGAQVNHAIGDLDWIDALDPNDDQTRTTNFLVEGRQAEIHERITTQKMILQGALTLAQRLNRPQAGELQQAVARADQTRATYDRKRGQALASSRMPDAASTDRDLLKIARETLARPDYEVGEILRLVVNSDKVSRSKSSSEIDIDEIDVSLSGDVTLSGTETTTNYEWEQFQVATAEPVGDRYYVFYNTLKYFTVGGTTTPLNRWLLSGRLQVDEILKENIDR